MQSILIAAAGSFAITTSIGYLHDSYSDWGWYHKLNLGSGVAAAAITAIACYFIP